MVGDPGIALGMDFVVCSGLILNGFLASKNLMIRKSTETLSKSTEFSIFILGNFPLMQAVSLVGGKQHAQS